MIFPFSNSKLTSIFREYWKVSYFRQIESETLEARQIFAGAHYFVLFAERKQRVTAKNILSPSKLPDDVTIFRTKTL